MQRVHKICEYIKYAPGKCKLCPKWERDPVHGKVKRSCRGLAEEVMSIVHTGDPLELMRRAFKQRGMV